MKNSSAIPIAALAVIIFSCGTARAQQKPPAGSPPPATPAAQQNSSPNPQQATPAPAPQQAPPAPSMDQIPANPEAAKILKTEREKISYAIGMNMGHGMHAQSMDIDVDMLVRGMNDELKGGATLLTDAEERTVIMTLQKMLRDKQMAAQKAVLDANKKAGADFLAENKTKDGVVTLADGLQYKILTAGNGPKPTVTDVVVCKYRGMLIDGKEFDNSVKRPEPSSFPVNRVIKGWTEALQLMPVGSKWQLFVPPDLAYGDRGSPPDIGPGSTLIFEIELVSIQPKAAPPTQN
jgi:FKBP-type peptidyl-prolyl cis-trans isomerase